MLEDRVTRETKREIPMKTNMRRSVASLLLFVTAPFVAVACGGGGESLPPPTTPAPVVTASVAPPPSAVASVDIKPAPPPEPARLIGPPTTGFCAWTGKTPSSLALRGEPHGSTLATLDRDGMTLRASLVEAKTLFVEATSPGHVVHGFIDADSVHTARDVAFGDALTLKKGVQAAIATATEGFVTLEPPELGGVAFLQPPANAQVACTDLGLDVLSVADTGPAPKAFAELGAKPVQIFAQPNGPAIATAHDLLAEVLESRGGFLKIAVDESDARLVAWIKASAAKRTMTPAQALSYQVNHMQMAMLGALSGGGAVGGLISGGAVAGDIDGKKRTPIATMHCTGRVTVFFGSEKSMFALATITDATFRLPTPNATDGPTRVVPPPALGLFAEGGGIEAWVQAEESRACMQKTP
jgi:hypothetical protein